MKTNSKICYEIKKKMIKTKEQKKRENAKK
jgi:hypothetical protein